MIIIIIRWWSAKSLALKWTNDGRSMIPRMSPRRTASPFCGKCPSTLTEPSQLIGLTLCLRTKRTKPAFPLAWLYTPRHQHLSKNYGKAYQIQSLGNRGWTNVGTQNNNNPGGYGSPWHHKEGHWKPHQENPWQHQRTWTAENNSFFYSPPSQAGPLHREKASVSPKVHGSDSDVERENQSQLH